MHVIFQLVLNQAIRNLERVAAEHFVQHRFPRLLFGSTCGLRYQIIPHPGAQVLEPFGAEVFGKIIIQLRQVLFLDFLDD